MVMRLRRQHAVLVDQLTQGDAGRLDVGGRDIRGARSTSADVELAVGLPEADESPPAAA